MDVVLGVNDTGNEHETHGTERDTHSRFHDVIKTHTLPRVGGMYLKRFGSISSELDAGRKRKLAFVHGPRDARIPIGLPHADLIPRSRCIIGPA